MSTIEQLSFDEDLVDADLKPYYWVNQSNALVNTRQNLSINERRLLYVLVSLVQPEDRDFKTYVLQTKELASLFGISESGFYERIRETVHGLNSKPLTINRTKENNKVVTDDIYWVQRATYDDGQITIKLSEDLAQFLIDLKSYTKYQLYNVLKLKSEFSWRIYELLKERERFGSRIFEVAELREKLAIEDGKYKTMSNFRAVVLDRAKKEIGEKTDIKFEYKVHKKVGRSIKSFIFYIYKNPKNVKTTLINEAITYDIQSILNLLITKGIRRDKAVELIKKYPPKYIEENLRYVIRMEEKGLENLPGYIVSAIENNYAESHYELDFEESLLQLAIGNADNRLKEKTERDIRDLEELYDHFINVINKSKVQTKEEIEEIKIEMERTLFKKMDDISEYRKSHSHPPLLEDDFEKSKIKSYFSKWLIRYREELPY
ncbi:replication initiation protein [Metabacillus halosaccharovorans]|uniref:replication initiation protein n=1 Tax=Metabacillus halosaccharovorans TaxID=930124 RepID=UPI00203A55FB|nr:replication initiation protein [Metabacillus halosaccharovorans]MCM3441408.1 replication initiation protein [Metabacillus halosaccharovorans]